MARKPTTPRLDLNPSSADRWTTCTASPRFIMENWDKLPPSGNRFSEEGTTAHEVAAANVQNRAPRVEECPTPIDAAMRLHGWDFAEYVNGLLHHDAKMWVETKFPLWYMPERNAMVDIGIWQDKGMHIVDYKYGEGIVVSPVENLQTAIYARSLVEDQAKRNGYPRAEWSITLHIYQPRGKAASDSPYHTWETTWQELQAFTDERISQPAHYILKGQQEYLLEFAPSEKACQWCPAKGFCEARQRVLTQDIEALAVIDDSPKPTAQTLSVEQLCAILKHKDHIVKWLKDAEEYAISFVRGGGKLPGFKLVQSRGGNRYWTNPKEAAKLLLESTILKRTEVIEEKVIGPAAAEKLLGKQKFGADLLNLIAKPPGVPVLAPEDDKREELTAPDASSEFVTLDEF